MIAVNSHLTECKRLRRRLRGSRRGRFAGRRMRASTATKNIVALLNITKAAGFCLLRITEWLVLAVSSDDATA